MITVTTSNEYSVTVTDDKGCSKIATATVTFNDLPNITIDGTAEICQGETSTLIANGGLNYSWSTNETSPTISVNSANTYSVTGTDNNGCSNSQDISVFVFNLPNASIDGVTEICEGGNTTFIANGGTIYEWNTGNNSSVITASGEGNYIVTVTNNDGCTDVASTNLTVNNLPNVILNLPQDSVCLNDNSIELNGGIPSGGEYEGIGVQSNLFNPSIAGEGNHSITYLFTDVNGCSNSNTQIIHVANCTNILESNLEESVKIFPNPSNGIINIVLEEWQGDFEVQLYDVNGRVVYENEFSQGMVILDGIVSGVYFLRVVRAGKAFMEKIVIRE